jgi:co-chaperonin GroES (HSP10)
VELQETLGYIDLPDKNSTATCGDVIAIDPTDIALGRCEDLLGKRVYFEAYKDSACFKLEDKDFAFIKYEDIKGYVKIK